MKPSRDHLLTFGSLLILPIVLGVGFKVLHQNSAPPAPNSSKTPKNPSPPEIPSATGEIPLSRLDRSSIGAVASYYSALDADTSKMILDGKISLSEQSSDLSFRAHTRAIHGRAYTYEEIVYKGKVIGVRTHFQNRKPPLTFRKDSPITKVVFRSASLQTPLEITSGVQLRTLDSIFTEECFGYAIRCQSVALVGPKDKLETNEASYSVHEEADVAPATPMSQHPGEPLDSVEVTLESGKKYRFPGNLTSGTFRNFYSSKLQKFYQHLLSQD
ncbi:hypothetical protein JYT83_01150 [bacterium AH-315-F18]|nr:hypothetical protein [bacterium AH-315-F18]